MNFEYNEIVKRRGYITIGILFIGWIILGAWVDNSIKLPNFLDVLIRMKDLACTSIFYESFAITLWRSLSGLVIAMLTAVFLGVASGLNRKFKEYFEPIYLILKSIPNISYILIVLIWSSSTFTMRVISFMVMFPVAYSNIVKGMESIDSNYLDVMKIYPETVMYEIIHVYLPLISPYVLSSISIGMGLTFKVGIMAEIIGSLSNGVGRQFQICRINVDMIGTFAWTLWLILVLIFLEKIVKKFTKV